MRIFATRIAALSGAAILAGGYLYAQTVTISPGYVNLPLGGTQQYTANVTGLSPATVTWGVTAGGGSITQTGLYTAPSTLPKTAVLVTATSTVNKSVSNAVYVNPEGPGPTITAMSPNPLPVGNDTITITASASAPFVKGATAQCNGAALTVTFVSVTSIKVSAYVGASTATVTCFVNNPGTWQSNSLSVPVSGAAPTGPTPPPVSSSPTIASIAPAALPLGSFTATITGTGFTSQSTATLGSTPLIVTSQTATSLVVSGFAAASGMVNLIAANGTAVSTPFSVQVGNPNALVSAAAARRFLEQAAFGPSPADAASVQALGFQGWLKQQFAMGQISNYNPEASSDQEGLPAQFLANAVTNPDQLRQKVAFALSQIFVTSIDTDIWNSTMIPYEQMLMADAFTNYRQIMGDVTLSPAMGQYLDMANNALGNSATGTIANQNYAREVMQLFTIGTTLLNPDGSIQFDVNNLPLPTYPQSVIADTARVFTGFTYQPTSGPVEWNDYINPVGPMVPYPSEHDTGSKVLLNNYAEPSNLTPQQDVSNALDNIFNHPNVGPFVGKILIQHLVKSNPSPAYIQRVAAAFANNGSGVRGDMQAVLTAILLDPEARANDNGGNDQPTDGHLQEPALFIAGMFRAFGGTVSNQNYFSYDLSNMGQDIYNSPSVFNFYTPTFVPPGSAILGPEFQIFTPDAAVYRANMVANLFFSYSNPVLNYGPGTNLDLTPYLALAASPSTLVAALDLTLTHGVMPSAMKQAIVTAVTNDTSGNLSRVETGAWLILSSSYYNVWH